MTLAMVAQQGQTAADNWSAGGFTVVIVFLLILLSRKKK